MYYACRDEAYYTFLYRRSIRIAPLYWLVTIAFFMLLIRPQGFLPDSQQAAHFIKSILFIPHFHSEYTDKIWPLYIGGWTLNYEMFFYVICAIGIFCKRMVVVVSVCIILLVLLGWQYSGDSPLILVYTDSVNLQFLAGIYMGVAFCRSNIAFGKAFLLVGVVMIVSAMSGALAMEYTKQVIYIAACGVVFGALAWTQGRVQKSNKVFLLLGNASYSIFITHGLVLYKIVLIMNFFPVAGVAKFIFVVIATSFCCIIIGIVIHLWVEKPVTSYLKSLPLRVRVVNA